MLLLLLFSLVYGASTFCPLNAVPTPSRPKCVVAYNIPMTFSKADEFCRNHGGHLSSVVNSFEATVIWQDAQAESLTDGFWVGGSDIDQNGQFSWIDGTPFSYVRWTDGQPNITGHCITTSISNGKWSTKDCNTEQPFVCISDLNKQCVAPCESGWTWNKDTNSCYILNHHDLRTWADAESACKEDGAHLVSIHSAEENSFVNAFAMTGLKEVYTYHQLWIGLSQSSANAQWVWSDGTPTDYFNWAKGEPNNYHGKEHCVMSYADLDYPEPKGDYQQKWNDDECETEMRAAVCKKPANKL